jgi:hypothetical protein
MELESAAVAELALKIYSLAADSELQRTFREEDRLIRSATQLVELREAPEDAVCSLVIDLMHYCSEQNIDWGRDVIDRAENYFHAIE